MGIGIAIAIIVIILVWVVKTQNNLVVKSEICNNALSQIGVQQESRWDILTNLADLIAQYSSYEGKALKEIIEQRRSMVGKDVIKGVENSDIAIQDTLTRLNFVVEAYPELKANELYSSTIDTMNSIEDKVR